MARKPRLLFLQRFLKTAAAALFFVSGKQRRRWICGTLQWLDVRLFILSCKSSSQFSSGLGSFTLKSQCHFENISVHPSVSKSRQEGIKQLPSVSFVPPPPPPTPRLIFNITAMNLNALPHSFPDALPRYLLQSGTRPPRRVPPPLSSQLAENSAGMQTGSASGCFTLILLHR